MRFKIDTYNMSYIDRITDFNILIKDKTILISNFKLKCCVCKKNINRGDLISRLVEDRGMKLKNKKFSCSFVGSRLVHYNCFHIDTWSIYEGYLSSLESIFYRKISKLITV